MNAFFFRVAYFREERDNGKVSTIDGTPEATILSGRRSNGGVRMVWPDQAIFQARVFADFNTFIATSSRSRICRPAPSAG